ncbi:MAG: hypothetical protein P4L33_18730 [Capsulimonadaceae bacterium]|nr:hypothetical protein [Capsulimonadaceae bacterium]
MRADINIRLICLAVVTFAIASAHPRNAMADLVCRDTSGPSVQVVSSWYERDIPGSFRGGDNVTLYVYNDGAMDGYLRSVGLADGTSYAASSAGVIDGLFDNRHMRISLRINAQGGFDRVTLTHEYGHYVWFHVFDSSDRNAYRNIYNRSRSAHCLITDYAGVNLEEGFAEAFAFFITDPDGLRAKDQASFDFLAQWSAERIPSEPSRMALSIPSETPHVDAPLVIVPLPQIATATELQATALVTVADAGGTSATELTQGSSASQTH